MKPEEAGPVLRLSEVGRVKSDWLHSKEWHLAKFCLPSALKAGEGVAGRCFAASCEQTFEMT